MKAEVTKRTDTHTTFKIVVDKDVLAHAREHAIATYRPQVKVAGFRPGKAPDHIVTREVGDDTIQNAALEHAVNHAYSDAVRQEALAVIAQPEVSLKKFVPYDELEFEATVETVPPVKLVDYKKIKKAMPAVKVDTAKIDETIEDLRRRVAKRVPALRPAAMDDEVKFDFAGSRDGKLVEGTSGKNYTLKLGSGNFIPGFEDELVDLKAGDTKTFTITFPKEYHEPSLSGQPVEFAITMHEVTALELPEVTDAFAAEVGPFKSVAELRTDIEGQLKVEAEAEAKRQYETELLDEVVAGTKVAVPDRLVAQQQERLKAEMNQRLAASGLNLEQYLQAQKQTTEQLDEQLRPEAEKRVKLALALSEVAKQEQLTITNEEIDGEIAQLRTRYTDPTMQKELDGDQIREDVYNHLMASKVIAKLAAYAQGN